ncbi:MAG: glutamate 5-kinase [Deltaproteobacteria bacterium]|uniref:Glutamate 5-kinase n=1 Tax=Candidatus Desulfacyla euxinica TaxID=2841693 RepID=A0A8J6MXC2_9DELT|nr:glutamate 5-kinase [Candidatus Desulfacyla euxinica]
MRKDLLKQVKRIVIKVGSGVLTSAGGLNMTVIDDLTTEICTLKKEGFEVLLVSSGAIASGLKKIGMSKRPQSVSQQQAMAAVGQSSLIMAYEDAFERHGHKVAQILLTRDDLTHRRRYLNARNTLFTLLSWNIVPIINENDTVVVDEIKFGDNDNLSAMVTNLTESQLLINLTDIDGLFDKDPRNHDDAKLIDVVEKADRKIMRYASSIPGFLGTGGMASKIKAARKVALRGVPAIIANGLKPGILDLIFSGKEEGTLFLPGETTLCSRKHWIAFTKSPKGEIVIDRGAERAILKKGKSLLPSGMVEVRGRFSLGNSVLLLNEAGDQIAVGMVNYHSGDIRKIIGAKSAEIESRLGFKHDDEVIHRDNLVLADLMEAGDDQCPL